MWCQLQQSFSCLDTLSRCDLLKKLYLCGVNYNRETLFCKGLSVVICLKSCIFVVSITTFRPRRTCKVCCDLLKKLYLCGVNYNYRISYRALSLVVICLKSCIFVVSITTYRQFHNQACGCDLLKKLYLCGVNYNNRQELHQT